MASAQAQSQLARLPRPASGASVKATLSATVDWLGSTSCEPDTVASILSAHWPWRNIVRFSL